MYQHSCRLGNTAHWPFLGWKNLNPAHNLPTLHRLAQFLGISCFDLWNVKKTGMQIGDSSTEWSLVEPKVLKPQQLRSYLLCCSSFRRNFNKINQSETKHLFQNAKKIRFPKRRKMKKLRWPRGNYRFPWDEAMNLSGSVTTWDSHSENWSVAHSL